MDEYTVQDAARLLHVSEKTVYRWIEQKKLTARKYGIQHFILKQEVEALAKSRPVHLEDDTTRLDILEQYNKTLSALFDAHDFRIRALEQRIAELSQELHDIRIVYASKLLETTPEPPQTLYRFQVDKEEAKRIHPPAQRAIRHSDTSLPDSVPPDAIPLYAFADSIHVHRRTLADYVQAHQLPHIAVDDLKRPGKKLRFVTTEQQEAIKRHRGVS